MAKAITSVHVDIARFVREVSKVSAESADKWLQTLADCLAYRDRSLHPYGASLLDEVDEYRKAEKDRKTPKSSALSALSEDSAEHLPRSDQSITDQDKEKKGRAARAGRKVKVFDPESPPYKFAVFFADFFKDWGKGAKAPDSARLQKWAAVFDAMNRIDGRSWKQIEFLLNCIDQEKPGKGSDFLWRNVILSPDTFRARWNEGKLHKFIPEQDHER